MSRGSILRPQLVTVILIIVVLVLSSVTVVSVQEPPPMFRASPARTGEVPGGAPMNNTTLWTYETEDPVKSSPAVHEGRVYVGTMGGEVLCLDAFTGQRVWTYETGGPVESSPAVIEDRVYIGSDDTYVYCLDALDGSLLWRTATGGEIKSSPLVRGGQVYVGSNDFYVYCFDAIEGEDQWMFKTGGYVYSSPSLWDDTIYFGSCDGNMYAVNASNGDLVWNYTADFCPASPAITEDLVIFGAYDGLLHYLNRTDGKQIHSVPVLFAEIYSSAGLFTWGESAYDLPYVFVATTAGKMVGIGPDGEEFWNRSHDTGITSSPLVVTEVEEPYDPFIIYGDESGRLHAIEVYNPYVSRLAYLHNFVEWHIKLGSSIQSSPFVWHERVYVGVETADGGGRVVCVGTINPEIEPYVELIDDGYNPNGEVWIRMVIHNIPAFKTKVLVEFEGETKEAFAYVHPEVFNPKFGPDGWMAQFNATTPEGMKPVIIKVYEDNELIITHRGQVMSLVDGWDKVDVRISEPEKDGAITKKILVAEGTASSNYTIRRVYAIWDDSDIVINCTGQENWTVALETAGLEEGWHTLTIVAHDDWRQGSSEVRVHIGEKDEAGDVTLFEVVPLIILIVILVVLFRTKPPRVSEKASSP